MSQPFDNRDYDVQKLAEKDAEIERLKEQNEQFRETAVWTNQENTKLKQLITELDEVKADRARLLEILRQLSVQFDLRKEELDQMAQRVKDED